MYSHCLNKLMFAQREAQTNCYFSVVGKATQQTHKRQRRYSRHAFDSQHSLTQLENKRKLKIANVASLCGLPLFVYACYNDLTRGFSKGGGTCSRLSDSKNSKINSW